MTTKEVGRIARHRAYWNAKEGGIVFTAELTGNDRNGVHWRAVLDGGNRWNGRTKWVAGRASGGGYDVRAAAMAEAVRYAINDEAGAIDWHNVTSWPEIAKAHGWTLYRYGDETAVVLIPGPEACATIKAEIEAERSARHV